MTKALEELTHVLSESRNEDIQHGGKKRQTWWRFCFICLLLLISTAFLYEFDLTRFPSQGTVLWRGDTVTDTTAKAMSGDALLEYFVAYPHDYNFTVDEPEKCQQQKPFVVLIVPVAPHNRAGRDIIRSTWGSESPVLGKVVSVFFLLGLPTGEKAEQTQQQVLEESREHRDLLQSDFLDSYKNLTIKTMVMLEWLDSRCSMASFAMKIDSDMFLNVHNLVDMLLNAPKDKYMTGLVASEAPVLRDPDSKWYLPVEVFPESQYPRYALGLGYVLSLDLPRKLVEASRYVKAVYIEDAYLGLCMRYLGIPPTDPPNWSLFNVYPLPYSHCVYSRLIAITTSDDTDLMSLWVDLKGPGPVC